MGARLHGREAAYPGPGEVRVIGSDFVWEDSEKVRRCSECGTRGHRMLVSRRGPSPKQVKKVVCSEPCRLAFDDAYWQDRADRMEATRP